MKKIMFRIISLCLIMSCLFTMTSFAASNGRPNIVHVPPTDTKLLPSDETYSKDTTQALQRGSLLAASLLTISNAGGGDIAIVADTLCNVDVDGLYVTVYLDRYNEGNGQWENQKIYDFEFTPADTDDGKLHEMLISFRETKQEPGFYYRAWAYHEVVKNGSYEMMKTKTEGVLITQNP